jgi:hypothetical protein
MPLVSDAILIKDYTMRNNIITTCVVCCVLSGGATADNDINNQRADIMLALKDAENRVKTCSMTMEITTYSRPIGSSQQLSITGAKTTTLTIDERGRVKFEMKGYKSQSDGKKEAEVVSRGSFNGTLYKEENKSKDAFPSSVLGADTNSISWDINPKDCMWFFLGKSLSSSIDEVGIETLVNDPKSTDQIILTTKSQTSADGTKRKYRFTIDKRHGFTVPRKEALMENSASKEWIAYYTIFGTNITEVSQNLWLPINIEAILYDEPPTGIFTKSTAKISNVSFTENLDDNYYDVILTPGTTVFDRRNGKSMTVAPADERSAEIMSKAGLELFKEENEKVVRSFWKNNTVISICVLLALLLFLGLIYFHRQKYLINKRDAGSNTKAV